MKAIIEFALRNRLLVLALTALLIGWGVWAALRLPIDAVPDVTNVQVQINANVPALSPLEVERQITLPVELAMFGLPDLEEVRSLSKFGLSQVTVIFKEGTDIYFARQQVQERLQEARGEIPEEAGTPEMGPISSGLGEIFQYTIESRTVDATELRTLQDWVVAPQLRGVGGVAEVNAFGGYAKQYQVLVRPEALVQYGLTLQQVLDAVAANNVNAGGGYITRGAEQLVVRGVGQVQDLDQIRAVVITSQGGTPVRVGDVADVVIGHTIRQGAVTKDGRGEVVTGIVMMRMGENSRTVVEAVKERFAAAQRSLPEGVTLRPFYDRTDLVERTIATVEKNLFEGAILVVAVLFLLLGNIRAALVVALAIPLSMLFALGMMVKAEIAGSLMSLGAIDFGLVVDGSVVMVENSMRHLSERERKPFLRTVLDSCAEVARPILFGFIPRLDEGSLAIQVLRLPSISLEESIRQSTLMERRLMAAFPDEIENIVAKTGRAEIATDPMGVNISDVLVMLTPHEGWKHARDKAELEAKMGEVLEDIPGMVFSFSQPIELRVNELVAGVRSDLAIKIYGDDLETLKAKADEAVAAVSRLEGATGFKAQQLTGLPQLQVTVLPDQLARYGINSADVMRTVEVIGGAEATTVLEGQRRFALAVRFPGDARRDPSAIASLLVSAPGGERVPVGQLARIEEVQGPADISHENGSRLVIIEGNVRGRDMGSFVRDVEALFSSGRIALPAGYRVAFGGQFENLERGTQRLMLVVPLSLLLIFLLLFTTFNSLRQAALVFTGIPLATVGGVFALLLRGMPFSISAGVGFIALFGIAVLNGVVMVSYMNELRQQGRDLDTSVREGGMTRLRPVLMTALVASLGFIPMAISSGAGVEAQRPLATVVIGGLVTSTLLTLLVLPLLYRIFERKAAERADHPAQAAPAEAL